MRFTRPGAAATALLAAAALSIALAPPAAAAERAEVAVYPGGVDFRPTVAYREAVLTVSGNGKIYRYVFGGGQVPSIGLFDPAGQLLPDGAYHWQLELLPTEKEAERLRAEAAENGGRPLSPWTAQAGTFTIRGGAIADPALAEARTETPAGPAASTLTFDRVVAARVSAEDDDAAVGSRQGVEARVAAAAARQAPAVAAGTLLQADPAAGDDVDATAMALGRSLERAAAATPDQLSAPPPARPRSDGSNGRPRS